ncbi:cellulose biosynthesis protein BcsF [Pseudomonas sp. X10]
MNIVQLLQVAAISALVTLILILLLIRVKAFAQHWLRRRLPPRYLKSVGVRRRLCEEGEHE